MIERIKSFLLILLISTSLLQSYLLAYSKPNLQTINESEYILSELLGEQKETNDLIFPSQIILHDGEAGHTVLYPQSMFYDLIVEKVHQRPFEGLSLLTESTIEWSKLSNEAQGIEIHFKNGIALSLLEDVMKLRSEVTNNRFYIDRIWITTTENKEEVRTFFFSTDRSTVYEAVRADITIKDLEQFIGFGSFLPNYEFIKGSYLPSKPIVAIHYRFQYDEYTAEQFQNSLFVKSTKILERDGTEIITDTKRQLTIDHESSWISYMDPVLSVSNEVDQNLYSAVKFINRHGGWNGEYMMTHDKSSREQSFVFRQYLGSYPIISSEYGYINIVLQKGTVSRYERSLINIDTSKVVKVQVALPGGEELDEMIKSYVRNTGISSIFPAYFPVITDNYVELQPKWAVEKFDGTFDFLN